MKAPGENPTHFFKSIELNVPMTPEEATEKLATFHNAPAENVVAAFSGLRNFTEGTVEFRETVNSGYPCIIMEGKTPDGKRAWSSLIDKWSGQPQMRCG
ncbi:hypothetical protein M0P48_03815 [Candidatus Gracilibacteria bacterium]|jgi:hypothetical protein|nr:hypothetical protein [Candidatus Gracilibacteria bacterium]